MPLGARPAYLTKDQKEKHKQKEINKKSSPGDGEAPRRST